MERSQSQHPQVYLLEIELLPEASRKLQRLLQSSYHDFLRIDVSRLYPSVWEEPIRTQKLGALACDF